MEGLFDFIGREAGLLNGSEVEEREHAASDAAPDARTGKRREFLHLMELHAFLSHLFNNGDRKRVLVHGAEACGEFKRFFAGRAGEEFDFLNLGLALRERARFVEADVLQFPCFLKEEPALDEKAAAGGRGERRDDRHGG